MIGNRMFVAGVVATVAGSLEGYVRIDAHRERFAFAIKSVVEAPPLAAVGMDQQIQAVAVGHRQRPAGLDPVPQLHVLELAHVRPLSPWNG